MCVGVYNDGVSVLLCVSLDGGVLLGQLVHVVVLFCAHLGAQSLLQEGVSSSL